MARSGYVRKDWELYDSTGLVRTAIKTETEAHDLVLIDANVNGCWAKHYTTEQTILWSDVCAEPWPSDETGSPYGTPPEGWPYGNGC